MATKLLVATTNQKKLKELKELLADLPVKLLSLDDFPNAVEVEEDGATFRENAEKKALGYAQQANCMTLAEDSGLTVEYLDGEPGVRSARFSGPEKNDLENCRKILKSMEGVSRQGRGAAFHCVCALAVPEKVISVVHESVSGQITEKMWGKGGFGYDPLFFYPDFGTTFANVTAARKHLVSHRGKALRKMKEVLKEYLQKETV